MVKRLIDEPHGHHAHHRRMANKNKKGGSSKNTNKKNKPSKQRPGGCKDASTICDTSNADEIYFDQGVIPIAIAEKILKKCDGSRTVNLLRKYDDGSTDSHTLCMPGTSVVKKNLGNGMDSKNIKKNKREGENENQMISFVTGREETHFECDGKECAVYGGGLLQRAGEPCDISRGNADCEDGLVCIVPPGNVQSSWTGICSMLAANDPWYVDWENHNCVQDCDARLGGNCGGVVSDKVQNYDELYASHDMCCSLMLSWKGKECVRDAEALMDLVDDSSSPYLSKSQCWQSGSDCYNRGGQFTCCSGICYDKMCQ